VVPGAEWVTWVVISDAIVKEFAGKGVGAAVVLLHELPEEDGEREERT
jgi:hypothetical protein